MVTTAAVLTSRDRNVLGELEALVYETYQLWDEVWVGFSWRNYTFDHVMRVRNLARTIAEREGSELRALEFAATLHDITKAYDGEIMMRDGKRVLDPDGFWINEKLPPARRNRVTDLYDELGLAGTVHHVSGGAIATAILRDYGYDDKFCAAVRELIAAHLKPRETSTTSALALYDADTIDANIGLPALYRNVRITIHRMEVDFARRSEDLSQYLANDLESFLGTYLRDKIPSWINGKRDDFIAKLTTESGRRVARERIERLTDDVDGLILELEDYETNTQSGRLAVLRRFIDERGNPSLTSEIEDLRRDWASRANPSRDALTFLARYQTEINGHA